MPLTAPRDTLLRDGVTFTAPVAANVKIYAGALVALNASGDATPGAVATTLKSGGRCEETADNTGGAAGAITVTFRKGVLLYKNAAADPITRADINANCYIVDDESVGRTSGGSTRSIAGVIADVDSKGVWVRFA